MKPFWKNKNFQIRWNEPLGEKECPYAYRWVFIFFGYSIRIHKWLRSDDKRYHHSHSWWFLTFVLKGGYTDVSIDTKTNIETRETLKAGDLKYRPSNHTHYVQIDKPITYTILITGRPLNKWGFWINNRYMRPLRFFSRYGHPPCSEK